MEDIMTNEQMYTFLKMILKILRHCSSLEEAIKEVEELLKDNKQ